MKILKRCNLSTLSGSTQQGLWRVVRRDVRQRTLHEVIGTDDPATGLMMWQREWMWLPLKTHQELLTANSANTSVKVFSSVSLTLKTLVC